MDGHDWAEVVGAIGLFAFVITVITVIIIQIGATVRAKAALAREDGYRRLAERAVEAQEATERRLAVLEDRLGETRARVGAIETVLKQVE
jgi:hypothetical protein